MTLFEAVTGWLDHQERKHGLGDGYAERYINGLPQYDFLRELSDGLEAMAKEDM